MAHSQCSITLWSALDRYRNKLDGKVEHLCFYNELPVLFQSRKIARAWIKHHYGYLEYRPDLTGEPHGWQLPKAVKVTITVTGE